MFQGNVGEAKNTNDNIIINAKTIKNMFRENLKIQNIIIYIIYFDRIFFFFRSAHIPTPKGKFF